MRARTSLLLMFLTCAAPIALAWAAWQFRWTPGAAANYGELIKPRPTNSVPLAALRGKWVMVTIDAAACDAYCQKKLYFMRQIRKAQGEDRSRVERLWIITDEGRPAPGLLAAMEGTKLARSGADAFPGRASEHIYLVDPLGNVMMRFPRNPDPVRMIHDLKRLLKYSSFG